MLQVAALFLGATKGPDFRGSLELLRDSSACENRRCSMHYQGMLGFVGAITLALCGAWGQETPPASPPATPAPPPVLENTGKPMGVPFQCTPEDIQWAGLSCSEDDPCPIYLELSSVTSVGNRIFTAGNIHSATVTLYSIILGSEDAGQTWRELHPRVRGAGIDHIVLLDPEAGWASGQTLSPLLQDPFLLLTTDGGKTWRQRPIFSDSRESRYGSIQQFFFSDAKSGTMVIDRGAGSDGDRYEVYESPDGGESWTIKETSSKPVQLKRAFAAQTDWRVRSDRESYQVEHRQGERWTSTAGFAVKLGVCK